MPRSTCRPGAGCGSGAGSQVLTIRGTLLLCCLVVVGVQAEDSLRQRGKRGKKARQQVDAVAAAFILQSYLDAHKNVIG